jgi:hypothetical protein
VLLDEHSSQTCRSSVVVRLSHKLEGRTLACRTAEKTEHWGTCYRAALNRWRQRRPWRQEATLQRRSLQPAARASCLRHRRRWPAKQKLRQVSTLPFRMGTWPSWCNSCCIGTLPTML